MTKHIIGFVGKTLKIIGIILLVIIILVILLLVILSLKPFVPNDYTRTTEIGGEIEADYLAEGSHEVSYAEYAADGEWKKFEIWYPSDMEQSDENHPVVIVANGTGVKASKYKALFRHLASWGFLVAGNEDPSTYAGTSADATLTLLLSENEAADSIFYQKLDTDHIGITGHSQGGVAVFNEIKNNELSSMFTCAVSLSPTQEDLAEAIGIPYDPEGISIPVFVLAGTGNDVITLDGMEAICDQLAGPKVMARRICNNHGEMLYKGDGYVTAWFMYWLQDDEAAGKAFFGENAEILENKLYQDAKVIYKQ